MLYNDSLPPLPSILLHKIIRNYTQKLSMYSVSLLCMCICMYELVSVVDKNHMNLARAPMQKVVQGCLQYIRL